MNASESEKKEKIQNAFRKLTGDIRRKSIALKKKKKQNRNIPLSKIAKLSKTSVSGFDEILILSSLSEPDSVLNRNRANSNWALL